MLRGSACLALGLLTLAAAGCSRSVPEVPLGRRADIFLVPDTVTVSGRIPRHTTLAAVLRDQQLGRDLVQKVLDVTGTVFDPRRLKADRPFRLVRTIDGLLRRFECEIDDDRFLRVVPADGARSEDLTASLVPFDKERAVVALHGEINRAASSLFAAMDAAGERPDLSLELADIFGGEIDFNTDLQPGDTFGLAVEKVYRDQRFSSYGPVLAAEFSNSGRRLRAIRFEVPGGKPAYYDEQGRSLKRFFLASPLKFTAPITSRFSGARFHPILKIYRPHFGVDYGAPSGSPVVAVAAGTVVSAGWAGEGGRLVHLRHASGYETLYMHLSSIAVRAGQHVSQGDLIGRVGMTGLATGPHLDYRVRRDGRPMNPLNLLKSMPPGEPVPSAFLAAFQAERDRALARMALPASAASTTGQ
jgi:murein DD-endopeptidase MepM/ murein hydrolase activator NlpD